MTIAELIIELQKLPQDALVVQSKDAEGNGFSPIAEASMGCYAADTTWSGDFGSADDFPDAPVAVCIWPTN
jgi:hypothetical protein